MYVTKLPVTITILSFTESHLNWSWRRVPTLHQVLSFSKQHIAVRLSVSNIKFKILRAKWINKFQKGRLPQPCPNPTFQLFIPLHALEDLQCRDL